MPLIRTVSHGLALAFVAGPWARAGLLERGRAALGSMPAWLSPLVTRVLERFATMPPDGEVALVAWVNAIHPERGRRLRALFESIAWPSS